MTAIKAAAVQISPVLYSREGAVGKVVQKIIELGRQGVQFATFPETVAPYHLSLAKMSTDQITWRIRTRIVAMTRIEEDARHGVPPSAASRARWK